MSGFADYLESGLLGRYFGQLPQPGPIPKATYYIGLATGTIDEDASNLASLEVAGGSYARQSYTNSQGAAGWIQHGDGHVKNKAAVTFPTATADWGLVTSYFIIRNVSATTGLMVIGELSVSKEVNNGNVASFATGEISIHLD